MTSLQLYTDMLKHQSVVNLHLQSNVSRFFFFFFFFFLETRRLVVKQPLNDTKETEIIFVKMQLDEYLIS